MICSRKCNRDDGFPTEKWDDVYGDRATEIVIIGIELDKEQVIKELDACLVTDEEWALVDQLVDPLPQFIVAR